MFAHASGCARGKLGFSVFSSKMMNTQSYPDDLVRAKVQLMSESHDKVYLQTHISHFNVG